MTPFWYFAGVAYEGAALIGLFVFLLAACWREHKACQADEFRAH